MRVLCFEDLGFGGWVIFSPDKLPSWGGAGAVGGAGTGSCGLPSAVEVFSGFPCKGLGFTWTPNNLPLI